MLWETLQHLPKLVGCHSLLTPVVPIPFLCPTGKNGYILKESNAVNNRKDTWSRIWIQSAYDQLRASSSQWTELHQIKETGIKKDTGMNLLTGIGSVEIWTCTPHQMLLVRSSEGGWDDWAWRWMMRNAYRILVGKPEGKRPRWRHRCSWEDNIRMDLKEIGWEGVDWMHLAQDRGALVNTVINLLRIPLKAGNFLTSWLCRWSFHNLSNTFPNAADVHRTI
jgi:hypothetical protein